MFEPLGNFLKHVSRTASFNINRYFHSEFKIEESEYHRMVKRRVAPVGCERDWFAVLLPDKQARFHDYKKKRNRNIDLAVCAPDERCVVDMFPKAGNTTTHEPRKQCRFVYVSCTWHPMEN